MEDLSLGRRVLYSVGGFGVNLVNFVVVSWALYLYIPGEGRNLVPVVAFGFVVLFGRIVDAIADPIVGYWSDRSRARMGRRIPFILFGNIPLIIAFVLIWTPPVAANSPVNVVYLALMFGLFFFFYTIVVTPYLALLPEITGDLKERVSITTWQAVFFMASTAVVGLGAGFLVERFGYLAMGLVFGFLGLVSFFLPLLGAKEKPREITLRGEQPENLRDILRWVLSTFKNRPFVYFVFSTVMFWLGFNMPMSTVPHFVTQIIGRSESAVGIFMAPFLLTTMITFPFINKLSQAKGKRVVYMGTLLGTAIVFPFMGLVGKFPLVPTYVQGLIFMGLAGIPLAGLFVLPYAILSDVIDYDETLTGERREAIYFGIQGILQKTAIGISGVVVSVIFHLFGYSSDTSVLGIRLIGPVMAVIVFIGFLLFLKYPLREEGGKVVLR